MFSGGDFWFTKHDYKIEVENNMTVIFPSFVVEVFGDIPLHFFNPYPTSLIRQKSTLQSPAKES